MSERVAVRVDTAALMRLGTESTGPIFRYMVTVGGKVETAAKRNASGSVVGVRSGNLRSSIGAATPDLRGHVLVVPVDATASYALAVHEGSKEHKIVPKNGKFLAWRGPAGPAFSRGVTIPAQRGRPFLRDALSTVRD